MIQALLKNKDLFMDPYLHQFVPSLITCVVRKGIANGNDMNVDDEQEMEFEIQSRKRAAELLHAVVYKFGTQYPKLQSRVVKTVMRVLSTVTGISVPVEGDKPKVGTTEGSLLGAFWFLKRTSVLEGVDLSVQNSNPGDQKKGRRRRLE
jgi:transcription initiation factor TFIID subunit 6